MDKILSALREAHGLLAVAKASGDEGVSDTMTLLAEAIAEASIQPTLLIAVEGGVLQSVCSDHPSILNGRLYDITIVDYDVDGCGPDEVQHMRQSDGELAPANCYSENIGAADLDIAEIHRELSAETDAREFGWYKAGDNDFPQHFTFKNRDGRTAEEPETWTELCVERGISDGVELDPAGEVDSFSRFEEWTSTNSGWVGVWRDKAGDEHPTERLYANPIEAACMAKTEAFAHG